ncbi:MAG: ATPase, T2SS/T4P/T4SS family [Nitrospiraceae bacterium]
MPNTVKYSRLADILIRRKLIDRGQFESRFQLANLSERLVADMLMAEGLLSESDLATALAEQYGLQYDPLLNLQMDFEAYPNILPEWMTRYCFAPLHLDDDVLTIAIPSPQDLATLDHLEHLLKKKLSLVVASRSAILQAVKKSERNSKMLARVQDEFRPVLVQESEEGDEVLSVERINNDQSPVVRLLDTIILNALQKRTSDIHIEPSDGSTEVKYRIDGMLYLAMEPLDIKFHNALISRLKVMSELDIAERRVPQDGRFKLQLDKRVVDFRISILPSAFGESAVIRILAKEEFTTSPKGLHLDSIGMKPDDLRRFRRAITASYGMVLVTGPTGSGKTTTLYAAINEINSKEDKFITIEDPVEYLLKGVIQIPVNEKKGLTFARGLRSILRHDPDKIMVGEIRDAETAQIAIASALTGHLVFTTVHANNAFDVIGRFVNMGIEPYNFVSSLNCILAQRLIRTICHSCKTVTSVTRLQCEEFDLDYDRLKGQPIYEGKGCLECHGLGYRGRQAITEFLALTDPIKALILDRKPTAEIRRTALLDGMTTLREAGLEKVLQGQTTLREMNRITFTG